MNAPDKLAELLTLTRAPFPAGRQAGSMFCRHIHLQG